MCPCCKNVSLLLSQQYINCTRVHSLTHAVLIMDMVGGEADGGGRKGAANAVYSCTFCVMTFKGLGFKALFCLMMHIQHIVFTVIWHRAYGKEPFRQRERKPTAAHMGYSFKLTARVLLSSSAFPKPCSDVQSCSHQEICWPSKGHHRSPKFLA